jgi:hypothetical protein
MEGKYHQHRLPHSYNTYNTLLEYAPSRIRTHKGQHRLTFISTVTLVSCSLLAHYALHPAPISMLSLPLCDTHALSILT